MRRLALWLCIALVTQSAGCATLRREAESFGVEAARYTVRALLDYLRSRGLVPPALDLHLDDDEPAP